MSAGLLDQVGFETHSISKQIGGGCRDLCIYINCFNYVLLTPYCLAHERV